MKWFVDSGIQGFNPGLLRRAVAQAAGATTVGTGGHGLRAIARAARETLRIVAATGARRLLSFTRRSEANRPHALDGALQQAADQ